MLAPFGEQPGAPFWVDIKAQHELPKFLETRTVGVNCLGASARSECWAEHNQFPGGTHVAGFNRVNLQEWRSCIHLHVGDGHYLTDFSGKWGDDLHFHFHRFQHCDAISDSNGVAWFYGNGNHHRWRRSVYDAAVIAINLVGHAIHFDPVALSLHHRDNMKAPAERREPVFKMAEPVEGSIHARAIYVDAILSRTEAIDFGRVHMSSITKLCGATRFTPHLRSPAHR